MPCSTPYGGQEQTWGSPVLRIRSHLSSTQSPSQSPYTPDTEEILSELQLSMVITSKEHALGRERHHVRGPGAMVGRLLAAEAPHKMVKKAYLSALLYSPAMKSES
jgi:hypothetical protein